MNHHSNEKQTGLGDLAIRYEVASQKGAVPFFEETVFCALADYFEKIRQLGKAQSILADGLTQHPHSSELCLRRAELLLQNAQLDEAARWLQKAAHVLPDYCLAVLARAEAFCTIGNAGSAMATLHEIRQKPVHRPRIGEEVIGHLKDISKKFRGLKEVLLEDPCNEEALEELWLCVELSGQFAQSAALHERLIDLYPYNSRAWYNLGAAWAGLGRAEDALEAYEYAYLIDPDYREAYVDFAELAFEKKDFKRAMRACEELTQRQGHDCDSFVLMGRCYEGLGNAVKARQSFHRATVLDGDSAEAYFRLGGCELREGRIEKALKSLAHAVYLDGETDEYQLLLAEAYVANGQPLKAALHFRKSLVMCCGEPRYWVRFAEFFAQNGQWKKALWVLDDGLANSYGPELGYFRAAALFELGRRGAGFGQLKASLFTNFDKKETLFRFSPGLRGDAEICAFVAGHQNTAN